MFDTLFRIITDICRPFHGTGLPSQLAFPEMEGVVFEAGHLRRAARVFRDMPNAHELLKLIGTEATQIAADARRPLLIYRMEDLSLAFILVETQCDQGIIVDESDQRRLEFLLAAFLRQVGLPISADEAGTRVAAYIRSCSLPDATPAGFAGRTVRMEHALFDELREFDNELQARQDGSMGLAKVGLRLVAPTFNEGGYDWCTPLNCCVFASTGADGIHYSFLVEDDKVTEESPVVITMPADCGESSIVAKAALWQSR